MRAAADAEHLPELLSTYEVDTQTPCVGIIGPLCSMLQVMKPPLTYIQLKGKCVNGCAKEGAAGHFSRVS